MKIEHKTQTIRKNLGNVMAGETFYFLGNLCMMIKTSRNGFAILELETSELLPCFKSEDEVEMVEAIIQVQ